MSFNKEKYVLAVQKVIGGLALDGKDGENTWKAIADRLGVKVQDEVVGFSKKALDLILEFEVGGGESYYNKFLKTPCWPKGQSGITIGIGYDLGYNTIDGFKKDWGDKLSIKDFSLLSGAIGLKGTNAQSKVSLYKGVSIPYSVALEVFMSNTLERFKKETLKAFPDADKLHEDAFGALVSLVFNRGGSLTGSSRVEMAAIRPLVAAKDYKGIAKQIRSMKRLWVGKGLDGLLTRREKEAQMIENCV